MDYSLLVGIHNTDQASRERAGAVEGGGSEGAVTPDHRRPQAQKALYSTAMESIQGEAKGKGTLETEDQLVTTLLFYILMFSVCVRQCDMDYSGDQSYSVHPVLVWLQYVLII